MFVTGKSLSCFSEVVVGPELEPMLESILFLPASVGLIISFSAIEELLVRFSAELTLFREELTLSEEFSSKRLS